MPKVSVIMPVYNEKPDFLKNSIESILEQTYTDFEFIIVDDASEMYVENIVESYNDKRIVYTRLENNSKICAALNKGLTISNGEYIAIMHSDDFSVRTRLEKQVEVLDKYDNVGLVNSYSARCRNGLYYINMPFTDSDELKNYLRYIADSIVHPNVMFRKSVLSENNLSYNNLFVFAEDYRLWTDMMPFCDFYTVPEILTIYNFNVNPSRQNKMRQIANGNIILLENYISLLGYNKADYKSIFDNLLINKTIKYTEYVKIKREIYTPLVEKITPMFSSRFQYSIKKELSKTIDDFNPQKRNNNGKLALY